MQPIWLTWSLIVGEYTRDLRKMSDSSGDEENQPPRKKTRIEFKFLNTFATREEALTNLNSGGESFSQRDNKPLADGSIKVTFR